MKIFWHKVKGLSPVSHLKHFCRGDVVGFSVISEIVLSNSRLNSKMELLRGPRAFSTPSLLSIKFCEEYLFSKINGSH